MTLWLLSREKRGYRDYDVTRKEEFNTYRMRITKMSLQPGLNGRSSGGLEESENP